MEGGSITVLKEGQFHSPYAVWLPVSFRRCGQTHHGLTKPGSHSNQI